MARLQFAVACAGLAMASALSGVTTATAAQAAVQTYQFNIPSGDLDTALRSFARTTRQQILFRGRDVRGKRSSGLTGLYSASEALTRLLDGTGLSFSRNDKGVFLVEASLSGMEARSDQQDAARTDGFGEAGAGAATDIVVTGTHIRGAPQTSPMITISSDEIRGAGQHDLGEVMRSLPQNFSGGQNPGVLTGGNGFGSYNMNGGSQPNLRGLGPSATLTLLNGRRLPYDSSTQGVDISAIPVAAIDRIEVIADGASAVYGTDAVGGVVNVVLKRRFQGLETSARIAGATDGGDLQQQYDAVLGQEWRTGSLMIAGDFSHTGSVTAGQRSLTKDMYPSATLLPSQRYYGTVFSAEQDLTDSVSLSFDGSISHRSTFLNMPLTAESDYLTYGETFAQSIETAYLSPAIDVALPSRWQAQAYFSYGRDSSRDHTQLFSSGVAIVDQPQKFVNESKQYEIHADGPLFSLFSNQVWLAIGGGHRDFDYRSYLPAYRGSQSDTYGFAELSIPLISPSQDISFVNRLLLSAAGRYESYSGGEGNIGTPKVGLIYSPTRFLDFKVSWGKSFKVPTLDQRFGGSNVLAYSASAIGGTGYAPGESALVLLGDKHDLTPERADNLTATISLHGSDQSRLLISAEN